MLSVGSKLLARVVAMRLQRWAEPWLHEAQCGFRGGRGVDDALQASRGIAEEVMKHLGSDWFLMSFFDIEKAYPRVCRDALWELLERRGIDGRLLKICKALHEHTRYTVKVLGVLSSEWNPDRGLREGCPSSPPLLNIYHDGVMEDFRSRRAEAAERKKRKPGLDWHYKVDGRIMKKGRPRRGGEGGFSREVHKVVIGDLGFADDTAIVGEEEEAREAEGILKETLGD